MSDAARPRKKIAVLGGGMSALTAVFELTSVPDWQRHYEITVYQVGWRLGGKGASGRNRELADRIEEHGFHFWWGFYDNAFHVIQRCYEELGRPLGAPLATWEEAFNPVYFDVQEIRYGGGWRPTPLIYAANDLRPGHDREKPLPTPAEYLYLTLQLMGDHLRRPERARRPPRRTVLEQAVWAVAPLWVGLATTLARLPAWLPGSVSRLRYGLLSLMLTILPLVLWLVSKGQPQTDDRFDDYVATLNADIFCAILRGMIKDDILTRGYDVINQYDLREWLLRCGARPESVESSVMDGIYDMVFDVQDHGPASLEAGTALRIFMRMNHTYKGAFLYRMMAGMGDTIFAPLYEVLRRRGVTFEFFHRVRKIHLSEDGTTIDRISIGRQVEIKPDPDHPELKPEYRPLYDVKGLPCWPSEPCYEQIEQGDALREKEWRDGQWVPKYNLESFWTPWQDVETLQLKRGAEFDMVVLGISIGALRWICEELHTRPGVKWDPWRTMLANIKTIQTQAFQLWMKPDSAGLGWPLWMQGLAVMDAYDVVPDYADAYADMSHLINRERWPPDHQPGSIFYFCNGQRGLPVDELPGPEDHDFPIKMFGFCKEKTLGFLKSCVGPMWPRAVIGAGPHRGELSWDLLVALDDGTPAQRHGEARLDTQFWRINIDPSERYVLTVAGSTRYRLRTDQSGCDNLFLTGDWIYNGANGGYIDSAVMSGMLTSRAITRRLLGRAYPAHVVGWDDSDLGRPARLL